METDHELIDIVKRQKAEISRLEKLIVSADLEYIIAKMPGYVYWKNAESEYMGCNEKLACFSGLKSSTDIIGKTDYDFSWGVEQADQFVRDDLHVMRTGKTLVTEHELPAKREDGLNLYVRTEKMPFYDRQGKVSGVLAIAVDLTDQKALEKRLIDEKVKAERVKLASLIKSEFIRNMEHDIRTPFSGIWSLASYLWEKETDAQKKESLGDITDCAKELLDYCNSILDFSKVEMGSQRILEEKFSVPDLIYGVEKIELPAAKAKGLHLDVTVDAAVPAVLLGDNYRLKRVLINLVSNAIKFTHEGKVTIMVSLLENANRVALLRFIVEDTGIGIPPDKKEYVFERFSRLTHANKGLYKGAGLGLCIVKQFMHEIEGELDLVSAEGLGSKFICTIPFGVP